MIYTYKTRKAMRLCYRAHEGQEDKSGVPYVFHPLHVAEQMDDEDSTVVALLHDVVEDSDLTLADLEKKKFGAPVIEALRLLTYDKSVPYLDYIRTLKDNPITRKVKLADLEHNSDTSRIPWELTVEDLERLEKYRRSMEILNGKAK